MALSSREIIERLKAGGRMYWSVIGPWVTDQQGFSRNVSIRAANSLRRRGEIVRGVNDTTPATRYVLKGDPDALPRSTDRS